MECVDVANKIVFSLLVKFISPEATAIHLFAILRVFLVVLGK